MRSGLSPGGTGEGTDTFNSPSSAILRHRRRPSPSPSSGPGTGAQLCTTAPAANAARSAPSGPLHLPFPAPPAWLRTGLGLSPSLRSRPGPHWCAACWQRLRPGGVHSPTIAGSRGNGEGAGPRFLGEEGSAALDWGGDELLDSQRYLEDRGKVSGTAGSLRHGGGVAKLERTPSVQLYNFNQLKTRVLPTLEWVS